MNISKFLIIAVAMVVAVSCINKNNFIFPGTPENPAPFNDLTAAELTSRIKIGWNLGNTLDTMGNEINGFSWLGNGVYANTTVTQMETAWGNPVTSKENIIALKEAGFNTIRIPVSWSKAVDSNHNIREDWMARVVEIVNYAVDNDMYIILNTHHDEGIFKFTNAETEKSLKAFKKIWNQIARTFRNYDEKLIFEALNEPRTKNVPYEWSGGNAMERINLNRHYKVFVDTVRASGGNNNKRILMINTYGASTIAAAINDLVIPADTAQNKIIVSVHSYSPYNFALNTNRIHNSWDKDNPRDISAITDEIDRAYNAFVVKGIPVIMGEFGAMNKDNEEARAQWAEFYVRHAMNRGIPCIWWDNGGFSGDGELFGLLDRRSNTLPYPQIVAALMRGIEGD